MMNKLPVNRKDEVQQLAYEYKEIFFKTDAGVHVLQDLRRFCGINGNPYVEGSPDLTAQKCGKLAVGLYIQKMLSMEDKPKQSETK